MSTVVMVENLYKEYRLGVIGHGTLYRDLQSWWAKMRGKPDPNSLLGVVNPNQSKERILALKDINLEINNGEVLGIIGHNGAGKSTLLKILSKITTPTSGSIKYMGRIASLLEVGTGFHSELTGRENIYLNGAINGMNKREINRKLDEIVDFSGVEKFLDTPVKRYSSGMFVRLGFAVAAHLDPDILVVDEVLAVGDVSFQKKAIGKMQEVSKYEGRTVIFVSHNMESIKNLCTRVVLMEEGTIINNGDPKEVINYYLNKSDANEKGTKIDFVEDPEKDYQILSYGILNDMGEDSDYLDRTKSYKMYAEYILRKPSDEICLQFETYVASPQSGVSVGTSVIGWSERHYKRYVDASENLDKDAGKYRVEVNVPGYMINSGKYKLIVQLVYARNIYEKNTKGVLFDLYDTDSSHMFKSGRKGGLIAIPLDWKQVVLD
jgi:lipopolysaccharide transport system ATP-binding protein